MKHVFSTLKVSATIASDLRELATLARCIYRGLSESEAWNAAMIDHLALHPRAPGYLQDHGSKFDRFWGHSPGSRPTAAALVGLSPLQAGEAARRHVELDPTPLTFAQATAVHAVNGASRDAWRTARSSLNKFGSNGFNASARGWMGVLALTAGDLELSIEAYEHARRSSHGVLRRSSLCSLFLVSSLQGDRIRALGALDALGELGEAKVSSSADLVLSTWRQRLDSRRIASLTAASMDIVARFRPEHAMRAVLLAP